MLYEVITRQVVDVNEVSCSLVAEGVLKAQHRLFTEKVKTLQGEGRWKSLSLRGNENDPSLDGILRVKGDDGYGIEAGGEK